MAHHSEETTTVKVLPPDREKIKHIWRTFWILLGITVTFWILLGITVVEFIIAFTINTGVGKTTVFVVLTIVKAAFIVGEFMHLKYETKVLFWSILIPLIFIAWMLVAFVYEGFSIFDARL
jgi:cytochrome c oxidase subunit IV